MDRKAAQSGAPPATKPDRYVGIETRAGVVLCFDSSAFYQDDFDPQVFVSKCLELSTSDHSLRKIKSDLLICANNFKSQLVDLLNTEYAGFLSLSSSLQGTLAAIHFIKANVKEVRDRVAKAHDNVQAVLSQLDMRIDLRSETISAQQTLLSIDRACNIIKSISDAVIGSSVSTVRSADTNSQQSENSHNFADDEALLSGAENAEDDRLTLLRDMVSAIAPDSSSRNKDLESREGSASTVARDSNGSGAFASEINAMSDFENDDAGSQDVFSTYLKNMSDFSGGDEVNEEADALQLHEKSMLALRISTQFGELGRLVGSINGFEIVKLIKQAADQLQKIFERNCEKLLVLCITQSASGPARLCIAAYYLNDNSVFCEGILRDSFVRPAIARIVNKEPIIRALSSFAPPKSNPDLATILSSPSEDEALAPIFRSLLRLITHEWSFVIETIDQRAESSATEWSAARGGEATALLFPFRIDFIVRCFWAEVELALAAQSAPFFSPAIPESFYLHYTQSVRFLSHIERLCWSPNISPTASSASSSLSAFREHPATFDFMKRWSLPTYFLFRAKAISAPLEAALADVESTSVSPAPPSDHKPSVSLSAASASFLLSGSRRTISAIQACWQPRTALVPLAPHFVKLTFELISTYREWIDRIVRAIFGDAPSTSVFLKSSIVSLPGKGHELTAIAAKSLKSTFDLAVAVMVDVKLMPNVLSLHLAELVCDRLHSVGSECGIDFSNPAALKSLLDALPRFISDGIVEYEPHWRSVVAQISIRLADTVVTLTKPSIDGISAIKSAYLMTGKQIPSAASAYVGNLTEPLKALFETVGILQTGPVDVPQFINTSTGPTEEKHPAQAAACITPALLILCSAVRDIVPQLLQKVKDLLAVVSATQASLQRLKRVGAASSTRNVGDGVLDSEVTDSDKIAFQLWIDVRQYVADILSLLSTASNSLLEDVDTSAVQSVQDEVKKQLASLQQAVAVTREDLKKAFLAVQS